MNRKSTLNRLYKEINSVILSRQHPVTGLLPASTAITSHGNYTDAWVRDNVYSVMCVWALAQAMEHASDAEKADVLKQATIKLMRGLLISMMRQSIKVETFKHTLNQNDALHAKYDTNTGLEVVADDAWGHLQIDATSLFLLMMAQMSATGLRIIKTYDEVDFVQNLVYYIANAYRSPDFGIWERGNKINNGKTEINASSVGMAKAALQVLDGFNLFGKDASPRAIIHSVPDAISNARNTLGALLPRESLSKETDSALLSIIGYPAFAVGNKTLITRTRDDILGKLGGNYGCKRFLWDGHQTAIEEGSRLYYEHSELANFEHIESEWPLFFTYLYIHALFDGNASTAQYYREKIESLMLDVDGQRLLPELYYVPKESIDAEKNQPKSQRREPNENVPLVWAQSLYWVGYMLDEGLVDRDDLDPLKMRRRSRSFNDTQIALVVLAENERVKSRLAEHSVIAETLADISPIQVMSASKLVETYTHIGANNALGLTGRPSRRLQSLATSQTYDINNRSYLCLSSIQAENNDYSVFDPSYISNAIERELSHIRTQWWRPEIAVFTWMVTDEFCAVENAAELFSTLREFQLRTQWEYVGYASANLAKRASKLNYLRLPGLNVVPFKACELTLEETPREDTASEIKNRLEGPAKHLLECLDVETDATCFATLEAFVAEHTAESQFGEGESSITFTELLNVVYAKAKMRGHWLVVRHCFDLLGFCRAHLTDGLAMLASRHLSVVVGKDKVNTLIVDAVSDNAALISGIARIYHSSLERTLTQELLVIIGDLMRTESRLFDGMRSIKIQNLFSLCAPEETHANEREAILALGAMSPAQLHASVYNHLHTQHQAYMRGLSLSFVPKKIDQDDGQAADTDWFEWRTARGSITVLDDDFLKAIWQSLACAHSLAFGDLGSSENTLQCETARTSMTPGEVSFANEIDKLTNNIHPAYFKSAVLEALYAYTQFCQANPGARFEQTVVFSQILEKAATCFVWDSGVSNLAKRNLDVLLEQSPDILQTYVAQIFENLAGIQAILP